MSGETGVFDVYGFELSVTPHQKSERYNCAQYALKREDKWEKYVRSQTLPDGVTLKRYVRKGVPPALRGWVWWHTSKAAEHRSKNEPGHYALMVEAGEERPCVRQIELDLPRTFPRNTWVPTPEGLQALRNVLVAYCAHNPEVGYCQGMNFLVALLLVAVEKDEERCFWLLVALLEGILYDKTFAPNLDGCHVEMRVLQKLLAEKLPKLHKHFEAIGCEVSMFATDWFLVLFATTLPSETAARVWDGVFLEGPKVLFRVAIALLQMWQPLLLRKDNAGEMLKSLKDAVIKIHDRDKLMELAYKNIGSLPMSKIRQLRAKEQKDVDQMLAKRAASRRKGTLRDAISHARALQDERLEAEIEGEAGPASPAAGGGAGGGAGAPGGGGAGAVGAIGSPNGSGALALATSGSGGLGSPVAVRETAMAAAAAAGQAAAAAGQAAAAAGQVAAASLNRLVTSFKGQA